MKIMLGIVFLVTIHLMALNLDQMINVHKFEMFEIGEQK